MQAAKYRIFSIILALFLIVSAVLGGTFAWQNFGQGARNETAGEHLVDVELLKLERLPDGTRTKTPVANASFYLFTEEGNQIGSRYTTDKDGKITIQLPKGKYYFEESSPAPGYLFDTDENGQRKTRYDFSITGDETESVIVTAYNIPAEGPLTIQKIVQNADGGPCSKEQLDTTFKFTVTFSDKGTYAYRINGGKLQQLESGGLLTLKHGETAVFENIPTGVIYNITEVPVPDYVISSIGHQGSITEEGCRAVFTNTYHPKSTPTGDLVVTKEVIGDGVDLNKKFTFIAIIDGKEHEFTLSSGESKEFKDLPAGTVYQVVEKTDSETEKNYTATVSEYHGQMIGDETITLPFINVYKAVPGEPGSLAVTKKVIGKVGDNDKDFTFHVDFSDGNRYPYYIKNENQEEAEGIEMLLTEEGNFFLKAGQTAVFKNLPEGVTYTIREIDTAGYLPDVTEASGSIVGDECSQVTFHNYVPDEPEKPGKLQVTKVLDGEYPEKDKDRTFKFILIVDGEEIPFTLTPGEMKEFELPQGAIYEIKEKDYSNKGYSQSIINGFGSIWGERIKVTVTNTYVNPPKIEIAGTKTWKLNGDTDIILPKSITVQLKSEGLLVEEQIVTPDKNGEWHYSFKVPKYDVDGKEIVYNIVEVPVDGYKTSYAGNDIVNTYIPPVIAGIPVLRKIVKGDNAPKEHFDFMIKSENDAPMPEDSVENTKVLSVDGSGEVDFGNITFTKEGTYIYTITELNGGKQGWKYDSSVYTVTATVTEKNNKLYADWTITKKGSTASEVVFTNIYEAETPTIPEIPSVSETTPEATTNMETTTSVETTTGVETTTALETTRKSVEATGPQETTKPVESTGPQEPNGPNLPGGPDGNSPGQPRTGDNSRPEIYIGLVCISGILLLNLLFKLFRKKEKQFLMYGQNDAPMPEVPEENMRKGIPMKDGELNFGLITFTNPGVYIYTIKEVNSRKNESKLERYIVTIIVKELDGKLVAEQLCNYEKR